MAIPFFKELRIGAYILKQKLKGNKRYPLVLMLEPLFRCNLACAGCGKIDYPDAILNRRMSVEECLQAADECGAPMVAIPGGEPLIHREIDQIVKGLIARKKFVSLCTNALLLEKKLHLFEPSPYLFFSVHLDGLKEHHDKSVCQDGVFEKAVAAIKAAKAKGFAVNVTARCSTAMRPRNWRGTSISPPSSASASRSRPATPMSVRPTRSTSSTAARPRSCSGRCSRSARARTGASCTPACSSTSLPATRITTARRGACRRATSSAGRSPATCSARGSVATFKELMETTDWDSYGTGKYEKCADCMAHCGYEATAANAAMARPLEALRVALSGPRTEGPMAPEIPLDQQRPAQYVFSDQVQMRLSEIRKAEAEAKVQKAPTAA